MNRSLPTVAFALGLLIVAWVGAGYLPDYPLPLTLVALIGAFYLLGARELQRYQRATRGLAQALASTRDAPPPALGPWLDGLDPSLRQTVRLRIEGDRVALPGPALAPYLVGLLVLLGMLGTFLGMIVTLKGTGLALERAADVEAIRSSLAAPVKGLGLAFGTSVAGVAASAALGLLSALARRERQRAARLLDERIASTLHGWSRAHRRDEALQLLRRQTEAMPALVNQLAALQQQLIDNQTHFHDQTQQAYGQLAEAVGRALGTSLTDAAHAAVAAIEPALQSTLTGLTRETATLRDELGTAVQRQLDGVGARLDRAEATQAARWQAAQQDLAESQRTQEAAAAAREQARLAAFGDAMTALAASLRREGEAGASAMAAHQQRICTTLETTAQAITERTEAQARATLGEIERLVQAAAQAPRAAAEVIAELRRAHSENLVHDNAVLDERRQLLGALAGLLEAVDQASTEQRGAIESLVRAADAMLEQAGARHAQTVAAEAQSLQGVAAQLTGSAAEMASLGEGFGVAVQLFSGASEQLTAQLGRIEAALGHSLARSDEQLAYYVAQAREIIDLTLGSHKQIVDEMQQLARTAADAAAA
ncbi:MAG: DUF802 domain-containing protein [Burkholderiales bacterium]|nr:DUF802 domain-containing protein [Burkholderiales bacterium]